MISEYAYKVMDYEYNLFMSLMHVSVSKHLFDAHFTVLWANGYFYELIGYSSEEYTRLFHNHVDEYYREDPDTIAEITNIILDAYRRREAGYEFECKMPVKGGEITWIRVTGRFTDELHDGIPVIYTIYTDITDLKKMQLELEDRTDRLRDALKMAENANRAKSDFLSRMSHDIRTPMNAIIGMSQIASDHLADPRKVGDCLKKISLSGQHLLGLINDVLDMSKIESGKMTINSQVVSLPEVLENVVAIMRPSFKKKRQRFSVRVHKINHEYFISDALRLRQIFINILSNASKFTPEGGRVSLEVLERVSPSPQTALLEFIFSDTGKGIEPEFIDHLFDAFTREQDSRVDKTEGSGLGMAITKKIVDMLGGSIGVSSRVGEGSVFTVSLPLPVSFEPRSLPDPLPNLQILLVDDDAVMCEYTMQTLAEIGVHGEWAGGCAQALEKLEDGSRRGLRYDAVILDWQTPDRDGLQTARMIRERMGRDLPILIISAYDWEDIAEEARTAGVNGFLSKPLFPSILYHGLRRYVLHQENALFGQKPSFDFSGRTFLLVEDNEINREIAVELLSDTKAAVECAFDGAQGVRKFREAPENYYSLILMDVRMPVMDGYEATRRIRGSARADAKTVPILAMTADAFTEDVAAAQEAGMNGHLAKPLEPVLLKSEISRFL